MKLRSSVGLTLLIGILILLTNTSDTRLTLASRSVGNKAPCPRSVSNCTCESTRVAWMSVNCANKTYRYVPQGLGNSVTEIVLNYNRITNLSKGCFKSAANVQLLSINDNRISHIDPSAFEGLVHLRRLTLRNNPIAQLHSNMFSALTSLTELNLVNTSLKDAPYKAFNNLRRLTHLYLGYNDIQSFPLFADSSNRSVVPLLVYLNLNNNQIPFIPFESLYLLRNLHVLQLNGNGIRKLPDYSLMLLPKLKDLSLARNNFFQGVSVSLRAFQSDSLTSLNIQDTQLSVTKSRSSIFQYAPQLKILSMANSKIDRYSIHVLQNLPRLNTLDISGTGTVPNKLTFNNTTNITSLYMNNLDIDLIDSRTFDKLYNLTALHLQNNRIKVINITSLPQWLWSNLTEIDLSKNQFICSCDIVWFRNQLRTSTKLTFMYNKTYVCSFPLKYLGRKVTSLPNSFVIECFSSHTDGWLVAVFTLDFCFCLLSLISALVYRYRWNLRYLQFVLKSRSTQYKAMLDSSQYTYDAFVIYSQTEMRWVVHELLHHLENEENLRLCIHHRDWLAGRDITDNILESIEASRKCLLIVSNSFILSQWCHFEMTMAQTRLLSEDRDNLVLVLVEEIDEDNLSPRLRLQMQRQTYIEWTDNPVGQQLFWARLGQALRRPDQSVTNAAMPMRMFVDVNENQY